MSEERRDEPRTEAFEIVNVVCKESDGSQRSFAVMLRDKSNLGLGAVYVGKSPLNPQAQYCFEEEDDSLRPIRLIWSTRLSHNVYAVGFQVCTD